MNFNPPPEVKALADATPDGWGVNPEDGLGRCIEAAKYVTTILRGEGVECRAMACDVVAFNSAGLALFEQGVPLVHWPEGAWTVGVDCDQPVASTSKQEPGRKKAFSGHLVVVGVDWFLDLTAIQLCRPKKLIIIPRPIVGPFEGRSGWVRSDLALGGALQYRFRPEFKSWRTTHAWRADSSPDYLASMRAAMHRHLEMNP